MMMRIIIIRLGFMNCEVVAPKGSYDAKLMVMSR